MDRVVRAHLVANARWHDTDFARLRILELLAERPDIRATVSHTFADTGTIADADLLITYTCDLRPTPDEETALARFVADGGRWVALHGTAALLDFSADGIRPAEGYDTFVETLGSRFISHPPTMSYRVDVVDPTHPLVEGIEPFDTDDELYLCEYHPTVRPLLATQYTGTFPPPYVANDWPDDDPRLVAYTRALGDGEVYYLTLGHCCGAYDMRPLQDITEVVRGSWENPVFTELLRRAIRWGCGEL